MQLPALASSPSVKVGYARYTTSRLRAGGYTDLAQAVANVTQTVLTRERAVEEASYNAQDALALRDHADDALDEAARDLRAHLAGRSGDANKEAPYTEIFHKNLNYYTVATVDETADRYQELLNRIQTYLPDDDVARVAYSQKIPPLLAAYTQASNTVKAENQKVALLRTDLESAESDLLRILERVYGTLTTNTSKKAAERFFLKIGRKRADNVTDNVTDNITDNDTDTDLPQG